MLKAGYVGGTFTNDLGIESRVLGGSRNRNQEVFNPTYLEIAKGTVLGHYIVHKFGAGLLTTTLLPVSQDNVYQMPTSAQALEFVSSSGDDTSNGSGARQITVMGLDANWNEVIQTVTNMTKLEGA